MEMISSNTGRTNAPSKSARLGRGDLVLLRIDSIRPQHGDVRLSFGDLALEGLPLPRIEEGFQSLCGNAVELHVDGEEIGGREGRAVDPRRPGFVEQDFLQMLPLIVGESQRRRQAERRHADAGAVLEEGSLLFGFFVAGDLLGREHFGQQLAEERIGVEDPFPRGGQQGPHVLEETVEIGRLEAFVFLLNRDDPVDEMVNVPLAGQQQFFSLLLREVRRARELVDSLAEPRLECVLRALATQLAVKPAIDVAADLSVGEDPAVLRERRDVAAQVGIIGSQGRADKARQQDERSGE